MLMRLRVLACMLLATSAFGQKDEPATLRANSTLVLVPALVKNTGGELAYSLTANDFVVTDNGVPQRVSLEEKQPLAMVVLMQTGGAARKEFAAYRHLDTMLRALAEGNPCRIAVVDFDGKPRLVTPFSADLDALPEELTEPADDPEADGAAIFDGVAYALDLLKRQPAGMRRAILLISQPQDVGSTTKREDLIREIGETNTAIYSLTFSPAKQKLKRGLLFKENTPGNKPISVGACVNCVAYFDLGKPLGIAYEAMGRDAASEVAGLSGGESVEFESKASFETGVSGLANHLTNRYELSFRPTGQEPGLHALSVTVKGRPELTVEARSGYWMGK